MRPRTPSDSPGFSIVELVVVVGIIVVMSAVALPNIAGYLRHAKVRGASQEVAGELQRARNKAIVKNVNVGNGPRGGGVVFAVLDANTYRFTILDDNFALEPPDITRGLAPLHDLPQGVTFVPGANTPVFALGFDQLGRRCEPSDDPTARPCAPVQTVGTMCPDANPRCTDRAGGNYIEIDPAVPNVFRVRVRDETTQLERFVRIEQGGKVMAQR